MKAKFDAGDGLAGSVGSVQQSLLEQQSLLPSVTDPKIFQLKCKPGNELLLVRSVMLKAIDMRNKGGLLKIKSAFCSGVKGLIYVKALSEAFAKEVIVGLRMLYASSFSQVPMGEMTSVLATTVRKKPIKEGQWVRIKRGPLKGDLARVVGPFEGGSTAFIQAVPRPDYAASANAEQGKKAAAGRTKVRLQQRLLDAEEARATNAAFVYRRHHPMDLTAAMYDVWENEHYKDGFLFKEVTAATYLDTTDVKPRLEELQLFRQRKSGNGDRDEDEPEDDVLDQYAPNAHFLKELADQIDNLGDEEAKEGSNALLPGDLVQVTSGDMRNLIARVVSVNDATRVARIVPYNNALTTEMSMVNTQRGGPAVAPGDLGMMSAATPYLTSATPLHHMGNETPRFTLGGETPMVYGDATPSSRTPHHGDDSDSAWGVTQAEREMRGNSTSTSMQNTPGSLYDSRRGGSSVGGWDSASGSGSAAYMGTDNSAYNSHSGSVYSQNSGMSSMAQSGSSTPMSQLSHLADVGSVRSASSAWASSVRGDAAEVTFRDWAENMVVLIKRGDSVGKWAVIQQRPDNSGTVHVSLRDKSGALGAGLSLHFEDLTFAV